MSMVSVVRPSHLPSTHPTESSCPMLGSIPCRVRPPSLLAYDSHAPVRAGYKYRAGRHRAESSLCGQLPQAIAEVMRVLDDGSLALILDLLGTHD